MLLIDTHTHLFHAQFEADRDAVMTRAREVCSHVLLPAIDLDRLPAVKALAAAYPGFALPMCGLHPTDVVEDYEPILAALEAELAAPNFPGGPWVAVGETGLDLYWDKTSLPRQQESLRRHLDWAARYNLPIVLHSRNAFWETAELVADAQQRYSGRIRGVFHCFVDGPKEAARSVELGFYIGIGGVLTYKNNGGLDDTLRAVPQDRIVLETDSPYLPPVPYRGKRNESSYLGLVAQRLADALHISYDAVAELTSANARQLFRIPA